MKRGGAEYVIPKSVMADKTVLIKWKRILKEVNKLYLEATDVGIRPEDVRYLQPQSLQTKIVVTMNARALLHFFELRCCERAQWEIRELANKMLALVRKKAPIIFADAGPTCLTQKICWEGKMSCGRWKNISGAVVRTRV